MTKFKLDTTEITLPKSGIKCQISLSYGDKIDLKNALISMGKNLNFSEEQNALADKLQQAKDAGDLESVKSIEKELAEKIGKTNTGIDIEKYGEHEQSKFCIAIKSWDWEKDGGGFEEISVANIRKLPPVDGDFLLKEIEKLEKEEVSSEIKKK